MRTWRHAILILSGLALCPGLWPAWSQRTAASQPAQQASPEEPPHMPAMRLGTPPGGRGSPPGDRGTPPGDSQPAGRVVDFQPGIRIDWGQRQVEVDAVVVLRQGLLELFACSPGTREHESIVCIQARPLHVYHALGLLGLEPGHPIRFNPKLNRVEPAAGDPVQVEIRYEQDGRTRIEPIERWMRRAGPDPTSGPPAEAGGTMRTRPAAADPTLGRQDWVFAGSVPLQGREGIEADLEGTVIAVVDFPSALVALPESHTDRNAELWLQPATEAVPPLGTRCTLIFRPGPLRLRLDATGHLSLQGRPSTFAAAARTVREATRENPNRRVHVEIDPTSPEAERNLLRRLLNELGIPKEQLIIEERRSSSLAPHEPEALATWLDGRISSIQPADPSRLEWAESAE